MWAGTMRRKSKQYGNNLEQEPGPSVLVLPNGPVRPSEAAALRVSLNLLPEPAMVFAIDGTILQQANASALSLLEGAENELIGESIYSLCSIGPEKNREVAAHLGRGATIRFEMDFRTAGKGQFAPGR